MPPLTTRGRLLAYNEYFRNHPFNKFIADFLASFDRKDCSEQFQTTDTFADLQCLKPALKEALARLGYGCLSPIQTALPVLCADPAQMVLQSHSGSGKTFLLSVLMVNRVKIDEAHPQIVCVAATTELVYQLSDKVVKLAHTQPGLRVRLIVNGSAFSFGEMFTEHILIGTPKEMASVQISGAFDMNKVKLGIYDDADIVVPSDIVQRYLLKPMVATACQVVLTSATISKTYDIPNSVLLSREEEICNNLSHYFIKCHDEYHKFDAACKVIDALFRKFHAESVRVMMFCNKRETVDWVKWMLNINGYDALPITGSMPKHERFAKLKQFIAGKTKILIATNLMARGLDIPSTKLVINFDLPTGENGEIDSKTFIHRSGRAGRFGKKAAVVTLLNESDGEVRLVDDLAKIYSRELTSC